MKRFFSLMLASSLLLPGFAFAGVNYFDQIDDTGAAVYGSADAPEGDLFLVLGGILNALLAVLGLILFVMIIYAGFLWMTAGGTADKVQKAKDILINAIIGLVILVAAFAISQYVILLLSQALTGGVTTGGTP